ncbi:Zn(II)2Cys6 transcription factor [Aspergillus lucknowensis]|uniref:Zn(2)-C6 fungal-type domain-containing protein n=1 Tax=Aspergillus lucknowensis TaxID=176173 RepID=A0ABR4LR82_9EURO
MPSRAAHSKSRHGCSRCKQRRVKCNEAAPCQHCVKRHEACSLERSPFAPRPDPPVPLRLINLPTNLTNYPASETWGMDLFLMSHFTSSTVQTLVPRVDVLTLWRTVVVEDATLHPFLLHGMLAISSLHLASLRPAAQRPKYAWFCQHHQAHAISQYRRVLQDVNLDQMGPALAMAQIIAFLTLAALSDNALPREKDQPVATEDGFRDILALFTVLRGVLPILHDSPYRDRFRTGPYGVVVSVYKHIHSDIPCLPAPARSRYELLRTDCLNDLIAAEKSSERAVCRKAIDDLEIVHSNGVQMAASNAHPGVEPRLDSLCLMKWAATVSSDFLALLHGRHTAALVILGEFAGLFELVGERWFLENWVNNVLDIVRAVIARPGLKWLNS